MTEIEKEEIEHLKKVIESSQDALNKKDSLRLKELSNQTTHSSCIHQHRGLIAISVIIYTLSKIIERGDDKKIKNWGSFVRKFNSHLTKAIDALKQNNLEQYDQHIQTARKLLESISSIPKHYMKEIFKKACLNKASKIYEHGISLEQTAKLLGVSQWDLSLYTGQSRIPDTKQNESISVEKRAKTALEFLS